MEAFRIALRCEPEVLTLEATEPSDFVHPIAGSIRYHPDKDNVELGRLQAYYVDIGSGAEASKRIMDILDSHSAELSEYLELFDLDADDYSDAVRNTVEDLGWGALLIISRVEVLPEYRGKGVALLALRRLLQRYGESALAAGKVFPLQFEDLGGSGKSRFRERLKLRAFTKNQEAANAKLTAYYGRLGFKPLPGTPFVVRSFSYRLPSIEEVREPAWASAPVASRLQH